MTDNTTTCAEDGPEVELTHLGTSLADMDNFEESNMDEVCNTCPFRKDNKTVCYDMLVERNNGFILAIPFRNWM